MRKVLLIPNSITAFGLAIGLFVILRAIMPHHEESHYQMLHTSGVLLLLAGFADLIDGAIARLIGGESEFGVNFDSLADAVSFGVVPSVLLVRTVDVSPGTPLAFYLLVGTLSFSICGILRLVRFNIKTQESKGDFIAEAAQKKNFTGLPIPAGALAAFSLNFFLASPYATSWCPMEHTTRILFSSTMMIVLGYFMVSRLKFPSLKRLNFRVASFPLVFMAGVTTVSVIYGGLYFLPVMMFVLAWGYVILALTLSTIRLIAGRKSKMLADFEPEPEELLE